MFGYAFILRFRLRGARLRRALLQSAWIDRPTAQKFSDGTLNEWGGGDYRDLMPA